ncbi:surface lipoprotein assembly modifier [Yoonia sp. GPGPB17]|uniref:surface lipoprotein assembly modifier n=1 Tax=Yoonia sp. GPGPB17 TaxID=3026147 RepID=UPI0030C54E27
MLPSTNVTRAAASRTFSTLLGDFNIDNGGDPKSGLGLTVGLGATYRLPLESGRTLQLGGQLGRTLYEDDAQRYWSGNLGADIIARRPRSTVQYGLAISRTVYDQNGPSDTDSPDAWRYTLSASHSQDLETATRSLKARLEYRDYVEQDAKDGPFLSFGATWSKPAGSRGRLQWGFGLERHFPELAYQRNLGGTVHLGYSHLLTDTFRLSGTASTTYRFYDTDFGAVDYAREDKINRLAISVADSRLRLAGAMPTFSCTYTDHMSNIALYETDYTDCSITLSFAF